MNDSESKRVRPLLQGNHREYSTFLAGRPKVFEEDAIRMLIAQLQRTEDAAALVKLGKPQGWGLHIVHLGHAGMLPEIAAAKARGAPTLPRPRSTGAHIRTILEESAAEQSSLMAFRYAPG